MKKIIKLILCISLILFVIFIVYIIFTGGNTEKPLDVSFIALIVVLTLGISTFTVNPYKPKKINKEVESAEKSREAAYKIWDNPQTFSQQASEIARRKPTKLEYTSRVILLLGVAVGGLGVGYNQNYSFISGGGMWYGADEMTLGTRLMIIGTIVMAVGITLFFIDFRKINQKSK